MKPQHAAITSISRCPCCKSRYAKAINGTSKHGNSAARLDAKRKIREEIRKSDLRTKGDAS